MGYERQPDFGTPEVRSGSLVTLTIDGHAVTLPEGTSVMRAAALAGNKIPQPVRLRLSAGLWFWPALSD